MDDFSISSLNESKNEWGARLITILTPLIIDGYKSILEEANKLCKENDEKEKYLMTFQNFISREGFLEKRHLYALSLLHSSLKQKDRMFCQVKKNVIGVCLA